MKHSDFLPFAFKAYQVCFPGGHCCEIPEKSWKRRKLPFHSVSMKAQFENIQRKVLRNLNLPDNIFSLRLKRDHKLSNILLTKMKRKLLANNESLKYVRVKHKPYLNKG
jgi:hypothetical protein